MKKLIPLLALVAFSVGCSSITTKISPSLVQSGVTAAVKAGAKKYTNSVPALRIAESVICSAANNTNLVPAQVIAAIDQSDWAKLKTPQATAILTGVLALYTFAYQSYGADAVNNSPEIILYLQAVCNGLHLGLPQLEPIGLRGIGKQDEWPLLEL